MPILCAYTVCLYCVPILCAYTVCIYSLPILCAYTVCIYCVPILCAYTLCLYCVPILCAYTVCIYCVHILSAYTVCIYSVFILCAYTVCIYSVPILCAYTVCIYSVPILCAYTVCFYRSIKVSRYVFHSTMQSSPYSHHSCVTFPEIIWSILYISWEQDGFYENAWNCKLQWKLAEANLVHGSSVYCMCTVYSISVIYVQITYNTYGHVYCI